MLVAGALLLLLNVIFFIGIDLRPSAWLFCLDIRYWSIYFAAFLWVAAMWLISESIESLEDYLPTIRMIAVIAVLVTIILAGITATADSLWLSVSIIVVVSCIVRSLYLFRSYWRDGADFIDMEEAKWFWILSSFIFVTVGSIWLSLLISVNVLPDDPTETETLFVSCRNGLQILIQQGHGTTGIRVLGFSILAASATFVYVAGKWGLAVLSSFRGN